MSGNRFAVEIPEDATSVASVALEAAEATFADFRDFPGSHYHRAPALSPEETWHAITREIGRVNALMVLEAEADALLRPEDLQPIHEAIFHPVFGDETLQMRTYEENVEFPIVLGTRQEPRKASISGASARSLQRTIRRIVADLNEEIELRDTAVEQRKVREVRDATRPAARAFGRLLAAHPWMDGNLRSAYPVLNFALMRLGLLEIALQETDEFNWCLGQAMRRDHRNVEPLADYLAKLIQASDNGEEAD